MINIQFGGSNNAQICIATIKIGKRNESLYAAPQDLENLRDLFMQLYMEPKLLKDMIGVCLEMTNVYQTEVRK